jgi:neutral amino acid transport system ATP-binding protein
MGISDWVVCMAEGTVIAEGPPQEIAADDRVIDAYLGTHRSERHRGAPA